MNDRDTVKQGVTRSGICGHTAGSFTCYKLKGHKGLHEEQIRLRDGYVERTNWGSDGLAPWATKDKP